MPDRRGPDEFRTSVLGRVDWACWLAAVGLLFLTVVAVFVQFAILGVITTILAIGLVAFDSWVNRPKTPKMTDGHADTGWHTGDGRDTGWRSDVGYRGTPPPAQNFRPGGFSQPPRQQSPRQPPPRHQPPPRVPPMAQPQRVPPRQPGGMPGQPGQPGQAPRGPQGQPQRPPFRPAPPDPGRDQDYQARR